MEKRKIKIDLDKELEFYEDVLIPLTILTDWLNEIKSNGATHISYREGWGNVKLSAYLQREETNQEYDERLYAENMLKSEDEFRERLEYERLKKKFENTVL